MYKRSSTDILNTNNCNRLLLFKNKHQRLPVAFAEEAERYWERATEERRISLSTKNKKSIKEIRFNQP